MIPPEGTDLIKVDEFMGMPIRIAHPGSLPAIPINDIADGIGYDRSTLRQLYTRNEELLKDFSGRVMIPTTDGGLQPHVCLTREGVIGILMKLDYNRIKKQEKKDRILQFQKWIMEHVTKEMQVQAKLPVQERPALPTGRVGDVLEKHMQAAEGVSRTWGISLGLARAKALVTAGQELGMDLTGFSRLLPPEPDGPIDSLQGHWLSATEIAKILTARAGGSAIRRGKDVNTYLRQNGYIYKGETGRYYMTDKGALYGKVFPFAAASGHVDYFLRWRPEIMKDSGMIR